MERFIAGESQSQSTLFPERLDGYIAEDNPVRVIDVFVDKLDQAKIGTTSLIYRSQATQVASRQHCKKAMSGATSTGFSPIAGWSGTPWKISEWCGYYDNKNGNKYCPHPNTWAFSPPKISCWHRRIEGNRSSFCCHLSCVSQLFWGWFYRRGYFLRHIRVSNFNYHND